MPYFIIVIIIILIPLIGNTEQSAQQFQPNTTTPSKDIKDIAINKIIEEIKHHLDKMFSFTASFKQVTTNPHFGAFLEHIGTISLLKPGRICWHYQKPEEKLIILDDTKLIIYKKAENEVYIHKDIQYLKKEAIASFLWESTSFKDAFISPTLIESDKHHHHISLVPKQSDNTKTIEIWVDTNQYFIQKIQINELTNNQTTFSFSNIQTNIPIPLTQFSFSIPKNARIYQQ